MAKRAEWRSLPDEPTCGVGLLRTWVRDAWMLRSVQGMASGAAVVGIVSAVLGMILLASQSLPATVFFLLVTVTPSVWFVVHGVFRRFGWSPPPKPPKPAKNPMPRRLTSILPDPLPEGTFPVYVEIRCRGVLTGIDVAAASFVEGWLYVEGRRASFAVCAADTRSEWRDGTLRIGFLDGQRVDLRLADDRNWAGAFFRHTATLWIADRDRPDGESILPPLSVQPMIRAGRVFTVVVGLVVAIPAGLAHGRELGAFSAPVMVLGFLGAIACGSGLARLHLQREVDLRARNADRRANLGTRSV